MFSKHNVLNNFCIATFGQNGSYSIVARLLEYGNVYQYLVLWPNLPIIISERDNALPQIHIVLLWFKCCIYFVIFGFFAVI